jgi:UDP-N-acetylglucosamine--N-acetylmuramyl-(pentapeptide) pyrophosphoryl-undecaprenol N-acetylglucosamine transferase
MDKQSLRLRRNKKIVLTGGHAASTAVAVVEALQKDPKINWQIYWIGAASAMEGRRVPTLGMKVLPNLGVEVFTIKAGRLQRKFSRQTIPALARIPLGFLGALYLLLKLRPDVTFSFGGFAAFPVVLASWLLRIPVLIHEQTVAVGLANKISAPFAKQIAIARKESEQFFPKE